MDITVEAIKIAAEQATTIILPSPCLLDPVPLPHNQHVSMKTLTLLTRYQIILLGEQRHIGANNLPKLVAQQCRGWELNPRPAERKSSALTTTPLSYHVLRMIRCWLYCEEICQKRRGSHVHW